MAEWSSPVEVLEAYHTGAGLSPPGVSDRMGGRPRERGTGFEIISEGGGGGGDGEGRKRYRRH